MTRGAVIFAWDNDQIKYTDIAAWNAQRINQWLDIPVTLITDQSCDHTVFDQVIIESRPTHSSMRWKTETTGAAWVNQDRCRAYDLSPYDVTLLVDADYIVNSSDLRSAMDTNQPLLCFDRAHDVATGTTLTDLSTFGRYRMPMWWATVMIFVRSQTSSLIFDCWRMIQQHWDHYRDIYHINKPVFRNDYALSIALNLVSGHTISTQRIPWSLPTIMPGSSLSIVDNKFEIIYHDHRGRPRRQWINGHDFHAMDKFSLGGIVAGSA